MANKSGIAEQIISLPKGGGELKGLGETFSPDLHTGTGNFSVPIAMPPGRNGLQPEVNLVYSTGNGNTCFGMGWQLSIPGVSRKASKGIPRYLDEMPQGNAFKPSQTQDTFLLSGAEDLVPVDVVDGNIRYRPRTEGLFALIDHVRSQEDNYWRVKTKDGLVSYYGMPTEAGLSVATESDKAVAVNFNPENPEMIFSWKLARTEDPLGNHIIYEYERDLQNNSDDSHVYNQLFLKRIKYIDYQDATNATQYLAQVEFIYEDRPDPFSVYTSGYEIRTIRRCRFIRIYSHPQDVEPILSKSYELRYEETPFSRTSLLSQVIVTGHDGNATERMPPLEFGYTAFTPENAPFEPVEGRDFVTNSLDDANTELVDLFGNGLPDIIQMNGVVRYWKNRGQGQFDLPRTMNEAPTISLADPDVQLIDANGEGTTDLLVNRNGLSGYFPLDRKGGWNHKSFRKLEVAPSVLFQDPESRLVDLTGDGVSDLLRSGNRLECFINDPDEGWTEIITRERQGLQQFPNINLSDPRVRLADMTGDGLQDIVIIHDRNVEYWPNKGYGQWGKRIQMRNAPVLP